MTVVCRAGRTGERCPDEEGVQTKTAAIGGKATKVGPACPEKGIPMSDNAIQGGVIALGIEVAAAAVIFVVGCLCHIW